MEFNLSPQFRSFISDNHEHIKATGYITVKVKYRTWFGNFELESEYFINPGQEIVAVDISSDKGNISYTVCKKYETEVFSNVLKL